MSNVSPYAEHLIRAAIKGIEASPETWDQDKWCYKEPECGTTYCIGGWMMLYDGWKHSDPGHSGIVTWFKGEQSITDPFKGFLGGLVYGDSEKYIGATIFTDSLNTFTDLIDRIEGQLEINFEEDCPCLYETLCNLGGCPCGVHQLPVADVTPELHEVAMLDVITRFVEACREDGDTTTVQEVLEDEKVMTALRETFAAGVESVLTEATARADRRVAEINSELQQLRTDETVLEVQHLRETVASLRDQLDNALNVISWEAQEPPAPWERDIVLRKLQGQVDELRSGTRRTPEFRKMKAALKKAQEDVTAMQEGQKTRAAQIRKLQAQVERKDHPVDLTKARQEGFTKAVESWQKALDIIKAQENL